LYEVVVRTPALPCSPLSNALGVPTYLKLENRQPTGAFKLRGAWTFIRRLAPQVRARGVVTYSSGNHGQALAYAAQRAEVRAVVVMPESAPAIKVEGVRRWGGEVVFAGSTSDDRRRRALELAAAEGLTVAPPYDHCDIIAGQGTVGLEIVEDVPDVAMIAVPVGGGGLVAGVVTAVAALRPKVKICAVEPDGARALGAALEAGHPVRLDRSHSIADGLLPLAVGELNFALVAGRVLACAVSDEEIASATAWLYRTMRVLAEPSGAATTAAARAGRLAPDGPVVLIVSGGNVDPEWVTALDRTT